MHDVAYLLIIRKCKKKTKILNSNRLYNFNILSLIIAKALKQYRKIECIFANNIKHNFFIMMFSSLHRISVQLSIKIIRG